MNFKELGLNSLSHADEYWKQVFEIRNGVGVPRFPNLKIVMQLLLILPFSDASVERIFSTLNNIKAYHRSKLCTDSITTLLHTKEGMEEAGRVISFEPNL